MAEIATLGLEVDSGGLRIAADRLDTLTMVASKAEKATGAAGRTLDTLSGKARTAGGATAKAAAGVVALQANARFQQDQIGRSTIDQAIARAEKDKGLPIDFTDETAGLIRTTEQLKYARELAGDFTTTLTSGLRAGESLWKSFGNAAVGVLNKISDRLVNDVLNSLFGAFTGSAKTGGGGLLGNLLGGLFAGPQYRLAASGSIFGLFSSGGYTGPGGTDDPAGIVHRGEIVWSQQDIARAGGVAAVEGLRLGRGGARGTPAAVPVRSAAASNTSIVVQGSQIVVQGNADRKVLAEVQKMLDERDRQISRSTGKTIDARNKTSQLRKTRA